MADNYMRGARRARKEHRLSPSEAVTLDVLAEHAWHRTGECSLSVSTISAEAGDVSVTVVRRSLRSLERRGLVASSQGGGMQSSGYKMQFPPIEFEEAYPSVESTEPPRSNRPSPSVESTDLPGQIDRAPRSNPQGTSVESTGDLGRIDRETFLRNLLKKPNTARAPAREGPVKKPVAEGKEANTPASPLPDRTEQLDQLRKRIKANGHATLPPASEDERERLEANAERIDKAVPADMPLENPRRQFAPSVRQLASMRSHYPLADVDACVLEVRARIEAGELAIGQGVAGDAWRALCKRKQLEAVGIEK